MTVLGHALRDGESVPLTAEGAPYLRVGESYLLGLVVDADGRPALPSPQAALNLANGTVAVPQGTSADVTIADEVQQMSPREAVDTVLEAPLLVEDQSLSPEERYQRLLGVGG